ncbi:MAG: hypothetical protein IPM55_05045 [Acidobacteria bacterium]|nr:hypothetical protein [Acidobacteriota bacterium]
MRRKLLLTCPIMLCLLVFVFKALPVAGTQDKGKAIIAGKVMFKSEPAKGVVIGLYDKSIVERNPNLPGRRVKSLPDGTFRFTDLPAGTYYLTAIAPGFVVSGDANFWPVGKARIVNVSEGSTIDDLELDLRPGGVITGRVTDSSGRPLVEKSIELISLDEKGNRIPFRAGWNPYLHNTDDRGIYRIYGLPAGRYIPSVGYESRPNSISFTLNRLYYQKTYHPDVTDISRAKILELKEGEEITGADIIAGDVKRTYDVRGRVIDEETGKPLAGVAIEYGSYDTVRKRIGAWGGGGERADAQGEFRLIGVLPGSYAAFLRTEENSDYISGITPFSIDDRDVEGIELRASRSSGISGHVIFEGPADPSKSQTSTQLSIVAAPDQTNLERPNIGVSMPLTQGMTFQLKGLQPGKHRIIIDNDAGKGQKVAVTRIERDGAILPDNKIDLGPQEQVRNLRVFITAAGGVIRGQVKLIGGSIPTGFMVRAMAKRPGETSVQRSGEVDSRGNFVIENLAPGDYEIYLTGFSYDQRSNQTPEARNFLGRISKSSASASVGYGSETQVTITIDLTRPEGNQ